MSDLSPSKHCPSCNMDKPLSGFHKDKSQLDGLQSQCKNCRKIHYYNNREQIASYNYQWRLEHLEHTKEYNHQYYRQHGLEHRSKAIERSRQWRLDNQEHRKHYKRQWDTQNADKVHIHSQHRRTRKYELPIIFTDIQWQSCLEYFNYCCGYCGAQQSFWHKIEMDHFIPLTAENCPGTVAENIVPACKSCNASKHNTMPEDWLIRKFGKRKAKQILIRTETYLNWLTNERE